MSAGQVTALGVETVALEQRAAGEIQGLPAQVVVPTNSQMHVVSAPLAALVETLSAGSRAEAGNEAPATAGAPAKPTVGRDQERAYLQAATQLRSGHTTA